MKKFKFLALSVLVLTVVLGSAFSTRFATQYFTYSGTNEFVPGNYTADVPQAPISGSNVQLAWIEVDATEINGSGLPMVDVPSTITSTLTSALATPKKDLTVNSPVRARVELKP